MSEAFGQYILLERIAAGGMAEVYLARALEDHLRGRSVVVKRMLPQLTESAEHVTMFLDEGRLGALLKHRHIVEVFDIGQVGKSWYMALDYIDGPDLGQVLKTARDAQQQLPIPLSTYIIARAAEGLHFAHGVVDPKTGAPLGIIHRDVSPQNILVSRNGDVKVGDFGVAKSEQQMHQTQAGLVKGKISYMSPEQISDQKLDVRTDVLALGVSLWEAIAHRRMYGGLSDVEIMKRIYFDTPPPVSMAVQPGMVDAELDEIVARAVARKRAERYSTAQELMAALDAWGGKQVEPPSPRTLAAWMQARFVPRATVSDAATAWAYKSPSKGSASLPESDPVTETTVVDQRATEMAADDLRDDSESDSVDATATGSVVRAAPQAAAAPVASVTPSAGPSAAPSVGTAQNSDSNKTPRKTLPKGTKLKPLKPLLAKPGPKRDLVLYVEDEQQNWEVAELLLKKNYDLVHAPDDQMACEILRTRGKELTAVLMDIQLKGSELDGISLVRLIRGTIPVEQTPSYARGIPLLDIPIFFVTAYAARYSEKELLAHGADKLVTKPVDFPQLTLALTSYQLRRAAERAPER